MRFGSALDTTARAAMVSPEASVTPVAAPSATSIRATSTPVLISTPACRAALAKRIGEGLWSAGCEPAARHRVSFAGAEHQQHRGAAGRPWAEKRSEHATGGDRRPQRLAVEPFAGEIRDGHRHPAQQTVGVGLAERAEGASGLQHLDQIRRAGIVDRRRRCRGDRAEHAADSREAREETRVLLGVLLRECGNARTGASDVVPEDQRAAVECRRARIGRRPHDPQAVTRRDPANARVPDRSPQRGREERCPRRARRVQARRPSAPPARAASRSPAHSRRRQSR